MADSKEETKENQGGSSQARGTNRAGDPGRTPGSAEGDEETVDQDIKQKLGDQKK